MNKIKVLGISGQARSGKDTFVGIAKNILSRNGYMPIRMAFADTLKSEAEQMLKLNNFKATVFTEDGDAKKLIRPLMVWWGCQRRHESDGGLYWVNQVDKELRTLRDKYVSEGISDKLVVLVSDCRFVNECEWIKKSWNGSVINLKRWNTQWAKISDTSSEMVATKMYDSPPNEEEAKNDPLVQLIADHHVEWESKGKLTTAEAIKNEYLISVVLESLNQTKYFRHTSSGTLSL